MSTLSNEMKTNLYWYNIFRWLPGIITDARQSLVSTRSTHNGDGRAIAETLQQSVESINNKIKNVLHNLKVCACVNHSKRFLFFSLVFICVHKKFYCFLYINFSLSLASCRMKSTILRIGFTLRFLLNDVFQTYYYYYFNFFFCYFL